MAAYIYFLWAFLARLTLESRLLRLSTKQTSQLRPSDYLYSTLGEFRMQLQEQTCQLSVEEFINNSYKFIGYFPETRSVFPCTHLELRQGLLQTSHQLTLLRINSAEKVQPRETSLVIDDMGVIRLICLRSQLDGLPSEQEWVSSFRSPKMFIYARTSLEVDSEDTLPYRVNEGGWGFSARAGLFRIFYVADPSKLVQYRYGAFSIKPGQIFDRQHYEPPTANIPGLKYEERCGFIKFLDFKSPIVFEINQFWPQFRVLDQGGYQILSIRFPDFNCARDLGITEGKGQLGCFDWFCPHGTFMLAHQCVIECPYPYLYQIKPNNRNRCVKQCEEGAQLNQLTRVCTCGPDDPTIFDCPASPHIQAYPLGCYCQAPSLYFNGFGCSEVCPSRFTPVSFGSRGVCVKCPYKCVKCRETRGRMASLSFLECMTCEDGFEVVEGLCRNSCTSREDDGQIVRANTSSECKVCNAEFCFSCTSNSTDSCEQCMRPYTLYKNTCIKKCPMDHILEPTADTRFQCRPIETCSPQPARPLLPCFHCSYNNYMCSKDCNNGQFFNNHASCYCRFTNATNGFENGAYLPNCLPNPIKPHADVLYQGQSISLLSLACPIKQYLYLETMQCLRCPFGCLTCLHDEGGVIDCTSCAPSYFLAVDIEWGNYCQRDSSLLTCEVEQPKYRPSTKYNPATKICDFGDNRDKYAERATRTLCYQAQPHCLTCLEKSTQTCTLCEEGFYLLGGSCFSSCPQGITEGNHSILIVRHQRICIMIDTGAGARFSGCSKAGVSILGLIVDLKMESIELEGYKYFLPSNYINNNEVLDPSGRVFFFASLSNRTIEQHRQAFFDEGDITCLRCHQHLGINSITGQCEPCAQHSCLVCPNPHENICSVCHNDYSLSANGVCEEKPAAQKDCRLGQYRWGDMVCRNYCVGFYPVGLATTDKVINCSDSCWGSIHESNHSTQGLDPLLCGDSSSPSLSMNGAFYRMSDASWLFVLSPNRLISWGADSTKLVNMTIMNMGNPKFIGEGTILGGEGVLGGEGLLGRQGNTLEVVARQNILYLMASFESEPELVRFSLLVSKMPWIGPKGEKLFLPQRDYTFSLAGTKTYEADLCKGLYLYGCFVVVVAVLFSIHFISFDISYKVDNFIILMQVMALSLLSMNLTFLRRDLYRFLYGFRWSVGNWSSQKTWVLGSFPGYLEQAPNNAHALLTIDNNFVRNCFPLLLLLGIGLGVFVVFKVVAAKQGERQQAGQSDRSKVGNYIQMELPKKVSLFFIFLLQTSCLPLTFYALSNLMTPSWPFATPALFTLTKVLSALAVSFFLLYSVLRARSSRTAGIYMFKRLGMALTLGLVKGNNAGIAGCAVTEIAFAVCRLYYEWIPFQVRPVEKSSLSILLVEESLTVLGLVLLGASHNLPDHGISSVLVLWALCLFYLVGLTLEMLELLLSMALSKRGYVLPGERIEATHIRTEWDYSSSLTI